MLAEACLFLLLLLVCFSCPGSAHPALVTLVRIISLLDPLMSPSESKMNASPTEPPSTIREKIPPNTDLKYLEECVRRMSDSGVSVSLITAAVNAGLGTSGQLVVLDNSVNEFTFDVPKPSTTSPQIRNDVDDLVKYTMMLDEAPQEDIFMERSDRDPFYQQVPSSLSNSDGVYVNRLEKDSSRHHNSARPQKSPPPPKMQPHRKSKVIPFAGSKWSPSINDWSPPSLPFFPHHGPLRLVRVQVRLKHGHQASVVSKVEYSPQMNEIIALQSARNNFLAEHPDDSDSPFDLEYGKSELKQCYVLASVGGVHPNSGRRWIITVKDDNNKVKSTGECVRQIPIFSGYSISLDLTEDGVRTPFH